MEKYSREKVIGLYFVYDGNGVLYLLSDRTQGTYKHKQIIMMIIRKKEKKKKNTGDDDDGKLIRSSDITSRYCDEISDYKVSQKNCAKLFLP